MKKNKPKYATCVYPVILLLYLILILFINFNFMFVCCKYIFEKQSLDSFKVNEII